MTIQLHLYSTSHCHLCEQAESMLHSMSQSYDIQWLTIEITDDEQLLKSYAIKIPVLKRLDNDTELSWPFSTQNIHELLIA